MVNSLRFSSVSDGQDSGFRLGMYRSIMDGEAVWVHGCEDGTGGVKCSTQFLYVVSNLLAGYQTAEARFLRDISITSCTINIFRRVGALTGNQQVAQRILE